MEYQGSAYATGSAFLDKDEYAYSFAKEIGLEAAARQQFDATIVNGEFVADTWGDGIDKLPYSPAVRESVQEIREGDAGDRLRKTRERAFDNMPSVRFHEGISARGQAVVG